MEKKVCFVGTREVEKEWTTPNSRGDIGPEELDVRRTKRSLGECSRVKVSLRYSYPFTEKKKRRRWG